MANNNTNQVPHVLVNRVSKQAVFPSGGIISSAKNINVPYFEKTPVPTDLRFTVPVGVHLKMVAMPDLLQKSFLVSEGWVIGPCTEAPVWVNLANNSGSDIELKAGDPVARLDVLGDQIAPEFIDVTPPLS